MHHKQLLSFMNGAIPCILDGRITNVLTNKIADSLVICSFAGLKGKTPSSLL